MFKDFQHGFVNVLKRTENICVILSCIGVVRQQYSTKSEYFFVPLDSGISSHSAFHV